ncbi:unnamed protein product [Bemisia tabaci]|uniref:Uncharacterized protein n=1 Tax=Bemisia tabaci TaxID=7038 RepID=A0A9P0AC99_BEMTA|nr:unnamed protein product [Bemisia tabaci]
MLSKVYQDHFMSCSHYFEWVKRFKTCQEFVEDEEHGNRPSTATNICHVEEVRAKVSEMVVTSLLNSVIFLKALYNFDRICGHASSFRYTCPLIVVR